jgi:hypothetical protein
MKAIIFFIILFELTWAQNQSVEYVNQTLPNDTPLVFARGLVSTPQLEHSSVRFSKNMNKLFWCTIKNNRKTIFTMHRQGQQWSKPKAIKFRGIADTMNVDGPFLSADGKYLYFDHENEKPQNSTGVPSDWIKNSNTDLWYVELSKIEKLAPIKLPKNVNSKYSEFGISVANNGNIYFTGYVEGALNNCGILYSELLNGKYTDPKPFPLPITKNFQNWTPFISPNENFLIYSKCLKSGDFGNLYICYKNKQTNKWGKPKALNNLINTWSQERFPYVSPDGNYLFFTRWTRDNNQDVFWVKFKAEN